MSKFAFRLATATALALSASGAMAASVALDTDSAANGLTDIFSATFDGALSPCTGADPSYCSFFGGKPGVSRAIVATPNPSGLSTAIPGGIAGAGAGSFLNLNVNGGNLELTGGTVTFDPIVITISGTTVVTPNTNAGFVLAPGLQTAALNGAGQAEFLVNLAPNVAGDFSTFADIVGAGDCTGALCALIPILSLDMVRYRLFIDYDETFTSFTGDFIGQTSNNSLVYATLNSTVVPLPAAGWLLLTAVGGLAARRLRKRAA